VALLKTAGAYILVIVSAFLLYILYQSRRFNTFWQSLRHHSPALLVAAQVTISYFYPSVAFASLSLFSCKALDPAPNPSRPPGEVSAAQGLWWSQDFDIPCFTGQHLTYALVIGVPMLLLLVAYPVALIASLGLRQASLAPGGNFYANYGHLYQDFRPELFFWGAVMEVRKLLLAGIVVGMQPFGTSPQLVGCWVLLMASVLVMSLLLPWQPGRLSQLHLLASSALAFAVLLNLMLVDPGFAQVAKRRGLGVEVLMLMLLMSVPVVLLVLVFRRSWLALKGWLLHDHEGGGGGSSTGVTGKLRVLGRRALGYGVSPGRKGRTCSSTGGMGRKVQGSVDWVNTQHQQEGGHGVGRSKGSGFVGAPHTAAAARGNVEMRESAAGGGRGGGISNGVEGSPGSSSESCTLATVTPAGRVQQ
jgi:hypothetical protein